MESKTLRIRMVELRDNSLDLELWIRDHEPLLLEAKRISEFIFRKPARLELWTKDIER